MELVLNQELEFVPEPTVVSHTLPEGILTSNYKAIVNRNLKASSSKSIFGIRQRIKSSQFSKINHTAAILKLSVFTAILLALI